MIRRDGKEDRDDVAAKNQYFWLQELLIDFCKQEARLNGVSGLVRLNMHDAGRACAKFGLYVLTLDPGSVP